MHSYTPDFLNSLCVKVARQLNQLPNELEQAEESFKKDTHLIFPAIAAERGRVQPSTGFTDEIIIMKSKLKIMMLAMSWGGYILWKTYNESI